MNLPSLFVTSFIVGLSGALMPGPVLAATIKESYQKGAKAGPLITLGHGLLEIGLLIALVFGIGTLALDETVMAVIGPIGGAVLMIFGVNMTKEALKGEILLEYGPKRGKSSSSPVLAGVITSVTNPYWTVWWLTIGASYVLIALKNGIAGISLFYFGHILSDFSWFSLVALGISQGRRIISKKYYQGLIFICGLFLIGLSIWFVYAGLKEV